MLKKFHFILLVSILMLFSCDNNPWEVDVNEVDLTVDWGRFDLKLYENAGTDFNTEDWKKMQQDYPEFTALYVQKIMRFGEVKSPKAFKTMQKFLADDDMKELFAAVAEKFKDQALSREKNKLTDAFKRYHYFFPNKSIPKIRTYISAFTYTTVTADGLLGVGLDMYLGKDFKLYPKVGIPKYKFTTFEQEYLPADAMKAWLISELEESGGKNLLENMVFKGKVLYLTKVMLPNEEAHLYFKYTPDELKWCENNEEEIWYHFVDMELLHADDSHKIRKYMGEAPFITGFPEGSPGRVGEWMGYRIVDAYMKNNSNLSLEDLIRKDNADEILQHSKYKPKQ